jgi:hypothetical protein
MADALAHHTVFYQKEQWSWLEKITGVYCDDLGHRCRQSITYRIASYRQTVWGDVNIGPRWSRLPGQLEESVIYMPVSTYMYWRNLMAYTHVLLIPSVSDGEKYTIDEWQRRFDSVVPHGLRDIARRWFLTHYPELPHQSV